MLRKKRNGPKLAALKQRAVLIAFFLRFSGPINGDPIEWKFDRYAMGWRGRKRNGSNRAVHVVISSNSS